MQNLGPTHTKKLFILYVKLRLNSVYHVLFCNLIINGNFCSAASPPFNPQKFGGSESKEGEGDIGVDTWLSLLGLW